MKYVPLILAGVFRKPLRSVLTGLSIVVAFALFGMLQGIDATFRHVEVGLHLDMLHTMPRYGSPLPYGHLAVIEAVPSVSQVAPTVGFAGFFQEATKIVGGTATRPEQWFAMNPEFTVPKAQLDALLRTRTGAIVGDAMMRKFGWKVGDRIPIESRILHADGSNIWYFDIVGLFDDPRSPEGSYGFIFNYEYLDEGRLQGNGTVAEFQVQVADPKRMTEVEDAIDRAFANSSAETRTFSEIEYLNYAFAQIGNVSFILTAIIGVTFFVLLFLTTNTMIQSVRERIPEFAVIKTVGFPDQSVLALIVAESLVICLAGAVIGLGIAWFVFPTITNVNDVRLPLPTVVILTGSVLAVGVAIVSALPGVWTISRLTIVQALAEQT